MVVVARHVRSRVQPQVLADPRSLQSAFNQDGRAVERTSGNNDRLLRPNDSERSVLCLDKCTDAATTRGGGSELVEVLRGGSESRGGRGEEETLDGGVDEELCAVLGGVAQPADRSALLLRVRTSEAAEAARVLVPSGVLLSKQIVRIARRRPARRDARESNRRGIQACDWSR